VDTDTLSNIHENDSAAVSGPEEGFDNRYAANVNPQWVRLLRLLQMHVSYERCEGAVLHTTDGRQILDFLSGITTQA
jgi:4-aminobutyrate aminotransferase-like enzyme